MECGGSGALQPEAFSCSGPNKIAVKRLTLQPNLDALAGLDDPHFGVFLAGRVSVVVGEKLGDWCPQDKHMSADTIEGTKEAADPLHGMHEELSMFTYHLLKGLGFSSSTKLKIFNLDSSSEGSDGVPSLSRLLACLLGMSNSRVLHEVDSNLQHAKAGGLLTIASGLSHVQVHLRTGELPDSDSQAVDKLEAHLTCRPACPEMTVEPFGQRTSLALGLEHIWRSVHDVLEKERDGAFVLLYVPTHAQLRTLLRSPDLRMAVATQLHLARLHQDRVQLKSALEQRESADTGESMTLRFKAAEAQCQYREEGRRLRLATKAEADALEGELVCLQGRLQKQEETLTGLRAEYERRVDRRLKDGQARRVEIVQAEIAAWKRKISNKRQRLVQMGTMMANRTTEKQYLEGVLANCQGREAERGADLDSIIAKRDQLDHERRRVEMEVEKAKARIVNYFSVPDTKNRRCQSSSGGWRGWS